MCMFTHCAVKDGHYKSSPQQDGDLVLVDVSLETDGQKMAKLSYH